MDLDITGRTSIVLGSTSGLGWAIAQGLAAEGSNVVVVGRDAREAEQRAASLPSAIGVATDLTNTDGPERVLAATRCAFGEVDILVLNGGGPKAGIASDLDAGEAAAAFDLLVRPHVRIVQAALPNMLEQRWGRIVAVGSSGIQQPIPNLTASNVGRAALSGYLKTLSNEVADHGITVNMVLPGRIDTDRVAQLDAATARRAGSTSNEVRQLSEGAIPLGRYGSPEEFAAVVVFLAGRPAAYVTGEQVRCDGGLVRAH